MGILGTYTESKGGKEGKSKESSEQQRAMKEWGPKVNKLTNMAAHSFF